MNVIIYEAIPSNCIHNPKSLTQLASVSGSNFTRTGDYINGATCQITLNGHNGTVEIGRIIHPDNTNKYYDITDIKWDTTGNTVVIGALNYLVTFYSKIVNNRVYLTGSTNSQYNNANIIPPGFVSGNRAVRNNLSNVISTVGGFTNVAAPMASDEQYGPWVYITVSMAPQTRTELTNNGEHASNNAFCTYVFNSNSPEYKTAMAEINSNLMNILTGGQVIDVSYGVSKNAIETTSHKYAFRMGALDIADSTSAHIVKSRIYRAVDKFVIDLSTRTTPNYGACQRSVRFPDGFILTLPKSLHNKVLYLGYAIDAYRQTVTWVLHDGKGSLTTEHEPDTFVFRHTINYSTPVPYNKSNGLDIGDVAVTTTASIGSMVSGPIAGALIGAGSQLAASVGNGDASLGNNVYQSGGGTENFIGDYAVKWVGDITWLNPSQWINKIFSVYDEYFPTYQTTPISFGSSSSESVRACTNGLYTGRIFDGLEAPLLNVVNSVLQNGFYVVN